MLFPMVEMAEFGSPSASSAYDHFGQIDHVDYVTIHRGRGFQDRLVQVIQWTACNDDDLVLMLRDARSKLIAEPRQPDRIAVNELIIQQDGALQMCSQSQANQHRELVSGADRQHSGSRRFPRRRNLFEPQAGLDRQTRISMSGQVLKERPNRL